MLRRISFDEFLLCLGMCGAFKYDVQGMKIPQRVEAIVSEYLGKASAEAALEAAAPKAKRFDPSRSGADPAFIACWRSLDLSSVVGFPVWEEAVFRVLADGFAGLRATFAAYEGDTPGLQQAELVSLALDYNLASESYSISMIVSLFEKVCHEIGAGSADLELADFVQFLVILAFARSADAGVDELASMVQGMAP
jgi:hypothetical protein